LDCIELIGTDAAMEEFVAPGVAIKRPLRSSLHERNREGPILFAHQQKCPIGGVGIDRHFELFPGLAGEVQGVLAVQWYFAGEDDVFALGTEDAGESGLVKIAGGLD
jgi:hypothetical protein